MLLPISRLSSVLVLFLVVASPLALPPVSLVVRGAHVACRPSSFQNGCVHSSGQRLRRGRRWVLQGACMHSHRMQNKYIIRSFICRGQRHTRSCARTVIYNLSVQDVGQQIYSSLGPHLSCDCKNNRFFYFLAAAAGQPNCPAASLSLTSSRADHLTPLAALDLALDDASHNLFLCLSSRS